MQRDREDAGYSRGAVFTLVDAAQMIDEAEAFLKEAKTLVSVR